MLTDSDVPELKQDDERFCATIDAMIDLVEKIEAYTHLANSSSW
jgi:hypothetical protein